MGICIEAFCHVGVLIGHQVPRSIPSYPQSCTVLKSLSRTSSGFQKHPDVQQSAHISPQKFEIVLALTGIHGLQDIKQRRAQ